MTTGDSPDGSTVEHTYDGFGRRVGRADGSDATQYLYGDPAHRYRLTAAKDPDPDPNAAPGATVTTFYYYDDAGHCYAMERDGELFYVVTDQVGSPLLVVASDGTERRRLTYTAYGEVLTDSDPSFRLHLGFAGGIADRTTGLVRFGHRDYDPAAGRWLARDPALFASGQFNLYAYAANDPVNLVDPSGLSWDCWWEATKQDYTDTNDVLSPLDYLADKAFEAGIENYSKTGQDQIRGSKDAMDTLRDGKETIDEAKKAYDTYRRYRKYYKRGKALKNTAMHFNPVARAGAVGIAIGSAINPFREHSLGDALGDSLADLVHGEGPCVKDDGGC